MGRAQAAVAVPPAAERTQAPSAKETGASKGLHATTPRRLVMTASRPSVGQYPYPETREVQPLISLVHIPSMEQLTQRTASPNAEAATSSVLLGFLDTKGE